MQFTLPLDTVAVSATQLSVSAVIELNFSIGQILRRSPDAPYNQPSASIHAPCFCITATALNRSVKHMKMRVYRALCAEGVGKQP